MKKINFRLAVLAASGFLLFSACSGNADQVATANAGLDARANRAVIPVSQQTAAPVEKAHWSVAVCGARAETVTMAAGAAESDSNNFATWSAGTTERVFDFPARLQNLSRVYFEANSSGAGAAEDSPVELCVTYDGHPKKRVSFDEAGESHIVASGEADDKECRCTE